MAMILGTSGEPSSSDLFDQVDDERDDLFDRIDLDMALKEDLYEMVGTAIKEAMRLREAFPVRLTTRPDDAAFVNSEMNTFIDLYLVEAGTLIETHFEKVATRVAQFVNDELV